MLAAHKLKKRAKATLTGPGLLKRPETTNKGCGLPVCANHFAGSCFSGSAWPAWPDLALQPPRRPEVEKKAWTYLGRGFENRSPDTWKHISRIAGMVRGDFLLTAEVQPSKSSWPMAQPRPLAAKHQRSNRRYSF